MPFLLSVLVAVSVSGAADFNDVPADATSVTSPIEGIDRDTICFAAFAAEANDKEKAGSSSSLIESAAGYFLGRMSANSRDSGANLQADMTRLNRLPESELEPEKIDCMKRYMASLMGIQSVLKQIASPAK